jgi:8-oxo-dGTP pyrophosphatase MutT (NUDIX family)
MFHRIGNDGTRYAGKNGAGIIFTDGKQVLLLKRAKGDHKESWGQPGGGVEAGETTIDAAIREAKEECGNFSGYRVADFEEKDGIHRWTTYLYKVAGPFNCNLSDEHSAYQWYNLDQLKSVNLHPQFKKNLPAYLRMISRKIPPVGTFKEWLKTQS